MPEAATQQYNHFPLHSVFDHCNGQLGLFVSLCNAANSPIFRILFAVVIRSLLTVFRRSKFSVSFVVVRSRKSHCHIFHFRTQHNKNIIVRRNDHRIRSRRQIVQGSDRRVGQASGQSGQMLRAPRRLKGNSSNTSKTLFSPTQNMRPPPPF